MKISSKFSDTYEWLMHIKSTMTMDHFIIQERSGAINIHDLQVIEKQLTGGACDICKKLWYKKRVTYKFEKVIEFEYYHPGCNCYPQCIFCGRYLIKEIWESLPYCESCCKRDDGWILLSCTNIRKEKTGKFRCQGHLYLGNHSGVLTCSECSKRYNLKALNDR